MAAAVPPAALPDCRTAYGQGMIPCLCPPAQRTIKQQCTHNYPATAPHTTKQPWHSRSATHVKREGQEEDSAKEESVRGDFPPAGADPRLCCRTQRFQGASQLLNQHACSAEQWRRVISPPGGGEIAISPTCFSPSFPVPLLRRRTTST